MPRDNEKIIEVLAHLQKTFKDALIPLIEADAPPWVVNRVFEMYTASSEMINQIGEGNRIDRLDRGCLPSLEAEMIAAIAPEIATLMAKQVDAMIERLESGLKREGE